MDVQAVIDRFHRIILAWDYENLWHRAEAGDGVYDNLENVPDTFQNIEVRALSGGAAGGGRCQPPIRSTPCMLRAVSRRVCACTTSCPHGLHAAATQAHGHCAEAAGA